MDNEEKLISLGEAANKLGTSQAFSSILDEIILNQHLIIEKSDVTETSKREAAYHLIRAINEIKEQMSVAFNRGQRVKARRKSWAMTY